MRVHFAPRGQGVDVEMRFCAQVYCFFCSDGTMMLFSSGDWPLFDLLVCRGCF